MKETEPIIPCFLDLTQDCDVDCRLYKMVLRVFREDSVNENKTLFEVATRIREEFSSLSEKNQARIITRRIFGIEKNGGSPLECHIYKAQYEKNNQ